MAVVPDYVVGPFRLLLEASKLTSEMSKSFHRYFQAGGSPENVIQLLSENYTAVAQTVNLLAEWLIQTGTLPLNVWWGYPFFLTEPALFRNYW